MMNSCIILMYHVVDRPRSNEEMRFCCPPEKFAEQINYLRCKNYSVIPLARLVQCLRESSDLPNNSIVITFDDGTACSYEHAMPVLKKNEFPATVFLISGLLGKTNEWLREAGYPQRRMLNAEDLQTLDANGIEIGSHTVTHPRLSRIPLDHIRIEVRNSKSRLEDILGHAVPHFAYPYGDYNVAVREAIIEVGYAAACCTRWGKNYADVDLFALRRVEVKGQDSLFQFALKLRTATHNMPPLAEARQLARRGLENLGLLRKRRY